jgi:hypothetical protein
MAHTVLPSGWSGARATLCFDWGGTHVAAWLTRPPPAPEECDTYGPAVVVDVVGGGSNTGGGVAEVIDVVDVLGVVVDVLEVGEELIVVAAVRMVEVLARTAFAPAHRGGLRGSDSRLLVSISHQTYGRAYRHHDDDHRSYLRPDAAFTRIPSSHLPPILSVPCGRPFRPFDRIDCHGEVGERRPRVGFAHAFPIASALLWPLRHPG